MTRRKRPYVPKTKGAPQEEISGLGEWNRTNIPRSGCYQCSQRRIHCDRMQPSCGKCVSKGFMCSGIGVRYRFRDESELKLAKKRDAPDGSESEAPGAVYTNEDTLTGGASSDHTNNRADDDADYYQPRFTGLRPMLTWKNTDCWKRFLLRYCMYSSP